MRFRRSGVAMAVIATLSACNGGGGGSSATMGSMLRPTVPFHAPVRIDSFYPHHQPHQYRTPVTEIHTRDLNGDGKDEVLWSNLGFDHSGTNWINSQVQIFGFNTGQFRNETTSWFRTGDNVYAGGIKINFGNFDGSGFTDVFLATFTDTPNHYGPSILLENTVAAAGGVSQFRRQVIDFGTNLHSHDSVAADFNGDGIADVLVTGMGLMLGSRTGNYSVLRNTQVAGSGISAADHMGDGTMTVVLTDGPGQGDPNSDTLLYRPRIQNGALIMDLVATLPPDRFFLPKWNTVRNSTTDSPHAVRNITMDFNLDGRPDVVVFSTMPIPGTPQPGHGITEVQFLRNDGSGAFTDVTDSVLTGFNHGKTVTYNPQLMDVNNDGLLDIFMSTTDYTGQPSTSVLLATREGKFVESYVQVFEAFNEQIRTLTGAQAGNNQVIAIVADGANRYLVSGVGDSQGGMSQIAVYASLIGTQGTLNAQATVALVQQTWPWMSAAEANAVLARTASFNLHGIPVIDWDRIWTPFGDLALDIHGSRRPLSGHVSVPGFDARTLRGITARDDLGRDFRVDLSSMKVSPGVLMADRVLVADDPRQEWSSRFVGVGTMQNLGFSITGRSRDRFATTASTERMGLTQDWDLRLSLAQVPGSPWMSFSGVFGTLRHSVMIDTTVSRRWDHGAFVQGSVMRTTTDFQHGLIDSISPLWSGTVVTGWQRDTWSLYGGVQPTIFSGSMRMTLPSGVDRLGRSQYATHKTEIRNAPVPFVGVQKRWQYPTSNMTWSAVTNDVGSYHILLNYRKDF